MGGFATWNLVEDLTTSYELLSRGWKGIYFPYRPARGWRPSTLAGVYRQRFQWCLDTMRLFFWDNPLLQIRPHLRPAPPLFMVIMVNYLISGLVFPDFLSASLVWFIGTGTPACWVRNCYYLGAPGRVSGRHHPDVPLPVLRNERVQAVQNVMRPLLRFMRRQSWRPCAYPPGRKPAYRVNNRNPFAESGKWWCLTPHLGLILLHLTLPFLSLWLGWALPRLVACNAIFSAVIIWILGDLVLAAWAKPQWRPALDPRQVYGG